MSESFEDNFFGYVKICDKSFALSVSGYRITLLPAYENEKDIYDAFASLDKKKSTLPEFIEGYDDQGHKLAFLRNNELGKRHIGMRTSLSFYSPLLIKSVGNTYGYYTQIADNKKWTDFDAIDFCDGNINAIYNPKLNAIKLLNPEEIKQIEQINNGAYSIHIKKYDEFTKSVDIIIDGTEAVLTFTVYGKEEIYNHTTTNLGSVYSVIRLSFKTTQPIEKFVRYYSIVRDFIAFLTRQRNVKFEVKLKQLDDNGNLFNTAVCKAKEHYENFSERSMNWVISINEILPYIPKIITNICDKSANVLLDILPDDNKLLAIIKMTDVQSLCTALEVEYEKSNEKLEKDVVIEALKEHIKKSIRDFSKSHSEIDINKETTIRSAFDYLDYTAKNKFFFLYKSHKEAIDSVVAKWHLPDISMNRIKELVNLRNQKTHKGTGEWGDNPNTYAPLFELVYACFLRRCGLNNELIINIIKQIF